MNSSNIPKLRSAREWRVYKLRQAQAERQSARMAASVVGEEQMKARLVDAQRNWKHGWATSYPAVGIQAVRKSKWRSV